MREVKVGDFAEWHDPKNVGVGYVTSVHEDGRIDVYWLDTNAVCVHWLCQSHLKIIPQDEIRKHT